MHDYITHSKFSTKPPFAKFFQTPGALGLFFMRVFFSPLPIWKFVHDKVFKARLGGDIFLSDVIICIRATDNQANIPVLLFV